MNTVTGRFFALSLALLMATSLLTACGGGDEDPDFDGPEWEGGCPAPEQMRKEIDAAIVYGAPPPPFKTYCPVEYAAMERLK